MVRLRFHTVPRYLQSVGVLLLSLISSQSIFGGEADATIPPAPQLAVALIESVPLVPELAQSAPDSAQAADAQAQPPASPAPESATGLSTPASADTAVTTPQPEASLEQSSENQPAHAEDGNTPTVSNPAETPASKKHDRVRKFDHKKAAGHHRPHRDPHTFRGHRTAGRGHDQGARHRGFRYAGGPHRRSKMPHVHASSRFSGAWGGYGHGRSPQLPGFAHGRRNPHRYHSSVGPRAFARFTPPHSRWRGFGPRSPWASSFGWSRNHNWMSHNGGSRSSRSSGRRAPLARQSTWPGHHWSGVGPGDRTASRRPQHAAAPNPDFQFANRDRNSFQPPWMLHRNRSGHPGHEWGDSRTTRHGHFPPSELAANNWRRHAPWPMNPHDDEHRGHDSRQRDHRTEGGSSRRDHHPRHSEHRDDHQDHEKDRSPASPNAR